MKNLNYKVEFDPSFAGGEYTGTGNQVLVPEDMVVELGMEAAFVKVTGHRAENIISYPLETRFDETGLEIQLPAAGEHALEGASTSDLMQEAVQATSELVAVEIAAVGEVVVAEPVALVIEEPAQVVAADAVQAETEAPAAGWRV